MADLERELDKQDENHRMQILTDIQDAQVELGKSTNRPKHVTDKLLFMSLYGEHRSLDELGDSVRITIHRRGTDAALKANENTDVRAGDLIEMAVVPNNEFLGLVPRKAPSTPVN